MWLLCLFLLSVLSSVTSGAVSCYSDNGEPVDWFFLYKLPNSGKEFPSEGLRYMYLDSTNRSWSAGMKLINESGGAVQKTLEQLYKLGKSGDVAYVLYNDQSPKSIVNKAVGNEYGHTKGVVLLDRSQGFWLVHSTPHFPPVISEGYSYPHSGIHNGQSFLCVTYPYKEFDSIGEQLILNHPECYESSVPETFETDLPTLFKLVSGGTIDTPPWNRQTDLTSLGGTTFSSFAKGGQFEDDLYAAWVAPTLGSNLLVQFWPNSVGVLPSNCSLPQHVNNIKEISFESHHGNAQATSHSGFSTHVDHSKWCVSDQGAYTWICVGDINRNRGEEHRGGGTVCLNDQEVWKSYRQLVVKYEDCADGCKL
ncbi:DNS2B protein, partial [Polypterus senegalus]|nr:deoxyribonuclease-2-alpha [Polypterus senegalus]MBN3290601.1 DNS2B protein [Polypterus senegalus]